MTAEKRAGSVKFPAFFIIVALDATISRVNIRIDSRVYDRLSAYLHGNDNKMKRGNDIGKSCFFR